MNLDVSVAPELAQLMAPRPGTPAGLLAAGPPAADGTGRGARAGRDTAAAEAGPQGGAQDGTPDGTPPTIGRLAGQLRLITGAPERWWGLVWFDPQRPVRVSIPVDGPYEAWLMIIPPAAPDGRPGDGRTADGRTGGGWSGDGGECGCEVTTVVAGEVTEQAISRSGVATAPLLPGKVRVHGTGELHRVVNRSAGYTVSVHARIQVIPSP